MEHRSCPLCMKNGVKRKLKVFQINLEEAIWSCESEQCPWPLNYERLEFIKLSALTRNWDESKSDKDDISVLTELSLYTPPVTPGGELSKEPVEISNPECSLTQEKTGLPQYDLNALEVYNDSNKLSIFESLGSVNPVEKNKDTTSEQNIGINSLKTLPKVVNIKETNINLTIVPDQHCNNKKVQNQDIIDTTLKSFDTSSEICTESNLNMQYKIINEQNGKLQSDATVNKGIKVNFDESLVNMNIINNTNTKNEYVGESDINKLLEDIFKGESHIPEDLNDEWLNFLVS